DLRGVSYERLRSTPVQWPAASAGGSDRNPIRYVGADGSPHFPTASGRAVFHPRPHLPAAELPDDDYPYILNTGRLQHQWHTLTKTAKVPRLNKLSPGPFVEVHPRDAADLGLAEGDSVEVASRRGRAVLPAVVTDRVRPGCCFAPFHWNDLFGEYLSVNAVTSGAVDPLSFQPEFKVCAVSLGKVAVSSTADTAVSPPSAVLPTASAPALFGLEPAPPPALTEPERRYLTGFLAGIPAGTPGVPVLPADAPFSPSHALWVNGVLAGMYSRAEAARPTAHDAGDSPRSSSAQQSAPQSSVPQSSAPPVDVARRQVVILWASQTGNAEEFAAATVERLAAH
ncbi:molybdopterin dinucleotide binding domain-containing protein, partial [Streptomyces asiaticus]